MAAAIRVFELHGVTNGRQELQSHKHQTDVFNYYKLYVVQEEGRLLERGRLLEGGRLLEKGCLL